MKVTGYWKVAGTCLKEADAIYPFDERSLDSIAEAYANAKLLAEEQRGRVCVWNPPRVSGPWSFVVEIGESDWGGLLS